MFLLNTLENEFIGPIFHIREGSNKSVSTKQVATKATCDCMKMMQPNLSDEINVLKVEQQDYEPPRELYLRTLAVPDEEPPRESYLEKLAVQVL